jgi:hypothetical protein
MNAQTTQQHGSAARDAKDNSPWLRSTRCNELVIIMQIVTWTFNVPEIDSLLTGFFEEGLPSSMLVRLPQSCREVEKDWIGLDS